MDSKNEAQAVSDEDFIRREMEAVIAIEGYDVGDAPALDAMWEEIVIKTAQRLLSAQPAVQVPQESKQLQLAGVEVAGLESTVGHLSQRVDEAVVLAEEAVELMRRFHSHAEPDDTPDMNAVFPALHFRNFVDDHARLMYKLAQFRRDPVEPAFLRLKKAADEVCAVMGAHGQISARDDRVQTLMDCLYETDPLKSVYAANPSEGAGE